MFRHLMAGTCIAAALGLGRPVAAQSMPADSSRGAAPNDYASDATWLCRPGRQDACAIDLTSTIVQADGRLSRENWSADPGAPIDCFYVYPTVSQDSMPRSDMVAGDEERNVIRQQFARFASVCRPYAPLYRQVTLSGLRVVMGGRGGGAASNLRLDGGTGYDDVRDAWNHYLARDNNGRGVVLIGHSQGAMVLTELVRREIDGRPIQSRVVSVILLGTSVPVPRGKDVGGAFTSIPLCRRNGQTGCLISYASFRSTIPPPADALFGRVAAEGMEAACTNPAALEGGRGSLHAYLTAVGRLIASTTPQTHRWVNPGPPIETPFVSVPGLLTAQCVSSERGSYLEVTVRGDSTDARADDIPGDIGAPGRVQAGWGLHLIDVNLAMGNLVELVKRQAGARGAAQGVRGTVPRTASGRPDLNGIWQALGSAHYDIEPHPARPAMAMRPGPVVPVPARDVVALGAVGSVPAGLGVVVGGSIPYTPEALARKKENQENWLARDPEIKCYLPGVPRATYMPFPFQILQSESAFFIAYEYAGAVRNIYLKDPGPPQVDTWMGQSVGRWEGDSFVVASSGFNGQAWFDRAGNHHSDAMRVVERFTMTTPFHIAYEATIEDARTFTRPWTIRLTLYRNVEPGARLGQFKCTEFVEELLYGHLRKVPPNP